jgi:hypothetical protein
LTTGTRQAKILFSRLFQIILPKGDTMKKKNVSHKLVLNKKTVANLDETLLRRAKAGNDYQTFTQPEWLTCDLPNCLTLQYDTCGCPDPPDPTGEIYCHLCYETDPLSCP